MAKGSGKDEKAGKSKKDEKAGASKKDKKAGASKKDKKAGASKKLSKDERVKEAIRRSRFSPVKTSVHEAEMKEISALRAFLTSLLFFALILAPVLGLGFYFAWDRAADLFSTRESAFMSGMGAGVVAAFVIAVLFTRKAVATS